MTRAQKVAGEARKIYGDGWTVVYPRTSEIFASYVFSTRREAIDFEVWIHDEAKLGAWSTYDDKPYLTCLDRAEVSRAWRRLKRRDGAQVTRVLLGVFL